MTLGNLDWEVMLIKMIIFIHGSYIMYKSQKKMIELVVALGAGLISFLSPCVLPLIPGYISYISGSSVNELIEKKM